MAKEQQATFKAQLRRPAAPCDKDLWAFLLLLKSVSGKLPRRGRTTVQGAINGHPFQATLEPDGRLSHWLRIDRKLGDAAGVRHGDTVTVKLSPAKKQMEPTPPQDLAKLLASSPAARAAWESTTTIARIDWVHWIESAKQQSTRDRRVRNACEMLATGKKRVCCFDPSGYYDKSLSAPRAAD